MDRICGRCHQDLVEACAQAPHFTMRNEVNLVRAHFGADSPLADLTEIPVVDTPDTPLQLADDMLRRRCLRCHVYSNGDAYAYTRRGSGCAACHMAYTDGELKSHAMIRTPPDQQCLSCHYANFVGFDYYGRYEHDFRDDFRTPWVTSAPFARPYGVEYHELAPDIHQQRGLACIDCHGGDQLMTNGKSPSCAACHQRPARGATPLPANVRIVENSLILTAALTNQEHVVPQLKHPAHARYGEQVACQVCHAQWSYNDSPTHLLRVDLDEYDDWDSLTVQSSHEIEQLLDHNLYSLEDELDPAMRDNITGEKRVGLWYKGFGERRWESIVILRDKDDIIKVFRPILNVRLSAIDADENVLFDNISGNGPQWLPYTPHTTGRAGLFFQIRFSGLLDERNQAQGE